MRATVLFLMCILALGSAAAPAWSQSAAPDTAEWGTRPIAEEKPLFDAAVAELEARLGPLRAKEQAAADALEAYWVDWPAEQRQEAIAWFRRSEHHASSGQRLDWASEQYDSARKRHINASESGTNVDPEADTTEGKAYRDLLWSLRLAALRREVDFRNARSLYLGIELQAVKSWIPTLLGRDLGINVDEFVADTTSDVWYIVRNHADKFWDELLECAAKVLVRGVARSGVGLVAPEFSQPPAIPGAVTTEDGLVVECLSDLARNSLVNAFTAALRKNFVDDMVDQGIEAEVAEYWWAKFILEGESETGPNAPRVKPVRQAIYDRIAKAVERTTQSAFQLDQAKEAMERELEVTVRERLRGEALSDAYAAYKEARARGGTVDVQQLRRSAAARARTTGSKLYADSVKLKFSEGLDHAEVLLRQGYVAYSVLQSETAFAQHGKPLIDEYWEIVRCLTKLERGTGAHLILQFYRWDAEVRAEFFDQCAKATESDVLPAAQQMIAQMLGVLGRASAALTRLEDACRDARARLEAARAALDAYSVGLILLEGGLTSAEGTWAYLGDAAANGRAGVDRIGPHAEKAVRANDAAEKEAEKACAEAEAIRTVTDPDEQRTKLDAVGAAHAAARAAADAAEEAAEEADEAAKFAIDYINEDMAMLRTISSVGKLAKGIGDDSAAADAALTEAADAAAAAETAAGDLAKAGRDGTVLIARARQMLGSRAQTEAARDALSQMEDLYAALNAIVAANDGCAGSLRKDIAALKASRDAMSRRVIEGNIVRDGAEHGRLAEAILAELASLPEEAWATVDVATAFAETAASYAADAATCLELAQASVQGGATELAAAAEAAIGQCLFREAKSLIERMPDGPERQALTAAYRAAVERERRTRALWDAAEGSFNQNEFDEAEETLDAAMANTACESYRARIAEALARVAAERRAVGSEANAMAAIEDCRFDDAQSLIAELESADNLNAATLRAELAAAIGRQSQVVALWQEAQALAQSGQPQAAVGRLAEALALATCEDDRALITDALADLGAGEVVTADEAEDEGPDVDLEQGEEPEPDVAVTEETEPDAGVAPAPGTIEGPWVGRLALTELLIDGAQTSPQALVQRIEQAWQAHIARRRSEQASGGEAFTDMELEIGEQVKSMIRGALLLLTGDLPLSFVLRAEAGGYRLDLIDMPPQAEDEATLLEMVRNLPVFVPEGSGVLRGEMFDKGSAVSFGIVPVDAAASRLDLTIEVHLEDTDAGPGGPADTFNVRSVELRLQGTAEPGAVPYAALQAEYDRIFAERASR